MEGLGHADGTAGQRVFDGREFDTLIELPESPAGGDAVGRVGLNRFGETVDIALIRVGALIDDHFGAGSDAARLFDVKCRFVRAGCIARCAGAAVYIHDLEAIGIDIETDGAPVGERVAGRERCQSDDADGAARASDVLVVQRKNIVVLREVGNQELARRIRRGAGV